MNSGGGDAEVELSAASAPPGSVRAMNPATASYIPGNTVLVDAEGWSYTEGSCANVYCHSKKVVTTGPVPEPGVDFPFAGFPIQYPAYTVDVTRAYATVSWTETLSCDGCHDLPPRTSYPAVQAGAGDSHSWIDDTGYEDLHGWDHGVDPAACATCHFSTVTDQGTRSRTSVPPADQWSVYDPVAITGYDAHVNGRPDIDFTTEVVPWGATSFDLSAASYDAPSKTCNDVPCHLNQTSVTWGGPYRYSNNYECNSCHQM
jgi:predicted CxxxxCH...CXXCH cytochrome family protein